MQAKPLVLRDFSGGLNTAADETTLPLNMTASMQNVDILDSRSIRRRKGYVKLSATFPSEIRALHRCYFRDGERQWLAVTGTALMALGVVGNETRVEAEVEDTYYTLSSPDASGSGVVADAASSGGAFVAATSNSAIFGVAVPKSDSLTVNMLFSPSTSSLSASMWIESGDPYNLSWMSTAGTLITATLGTQYANDISVYRTSRTFANLTATSYIVWFKKRGTGTYHSSGKNHISYFGVDSIDCSFGTSSEHKDSTLTATGTTFGFSMLNDKLYYGSAHDDVRSYDGTTTAAVSASGTSRGALMVENNLRLFAAGDASDRAKLTYTNLNAPNDWTGGGVFYFTRDAGQECTGLEVWRKRIYYFSPSSVYTLDTTGLPENWSADTLSRSVGCVAPRSLAKVPNGLVFLSPQGVHLYGIGGEFTQEPGFTLLSDNITPTIYAFTEEQRTQACGAYYKNRYWLAFPPVGGEGSTVLVYRFPESGLPGSWIRYRYTCGISALHVTRGDEEGLYAGIWSSGHQSWIAQLDKGNIDGSRAIDDYYVTPPIAPNGVETIKHFRPAVDLGVTAETTQSLTMTPYTDDIAGQPVTVTVTPNSAVQTIRAPLSARGRALKLKLSGSGAGQPRTLTSIGVRYLPPRIR